MSREDALAFFRWFTGRADLDGARALTAREAVSFLGVVAHGKLEEKLQAWRDDRDWNEDAA